jgi:hypothetical protein
MGDRDGSRPNGGGSEVLFALLRAPGASGQAFSAGAGQCSRAMFSLDQVLCSPLSSSTST